MLVTSSSAPFVKPDLRELISINDFEIVASKSLNTKIWAFVSSGATDLITKSRNSSTYSAISLRPRILRDVSRVDLRTHVFGKKLRVPFFASPVAMAALVHPGGERSIGQAIKASGMAQCISMSASYPLEDIVEAIQGYPVEIPHETPIWFQLYLNKDRSLTELLLKRVKDCGVTAIFLTVDATFPGKREADERLALVKDITSPVSGVTASSDPKGGGLGRSLGSFIDDSVTWKDLEWIRHQCPGMKLVLKGIQTSEDAIAAMEAGVDGIVVSNHGGRTLDTSSASILVLLELHKNCPQVFKAMDVMIDGGVSRGADVFKALCLGAKAVWLGRGTLYGVNYGYEGVLKVFQVLQEELEATMKLCGVTSLEQLHPGYLNTLDVEHLIPRRVTVGEAGNLKSRL